MSDSVIPWTVASQPPLSMEFSRQEYWSGLLFPSPADLPDLGIEPGSPALQAASLLSEPPERRPYNTHHSFGVLLCCLYWEGGGVYFVTCAPRLNFALEEMCLLRTS